MLTNSEIRLVELLPGSDDAPIQCRTFVTSISSATPYEAVSYVWGDGHDQASIEIDGQQVLVTKNLVTGLRRIRLADRPRTLWIDQISINQTDDVEKAQQVPLMGRIYSQATQMFAWLGEIRDGISVEQAQAAIDILEFFDAHRKDSNAKVPDCLLNEKTCAAAMTAMRTIGVGENEWWGRIWTLQEAVLPSRATILWGPCSIAWSTVMDGSNHQIPYELWKFIYTNQSHFQAYNNLITQIRGIEIEKRNRNGPLMAAYRWSFRKATDPLDKVYAFLGLFPPGTFKRIQSPDYKLPAATAYAMFTADLIEHHNSFHPITIFGLNHLLPKGMTPNVASWAVDMGINGYSFNLPQVSNSSDSWPWMSMNNYDCYSASGNLDIDWETFNYAVSDNSLTISAAVIDEICLVSPGLPWETMTNANTAQRVKEWYKTGDEHYRSQDWLSRDAAKGLWRWPISFWRGLVGDVARVVYDFEPTRRATEDDLLRAQDFVRDGKRDLICQEIFLTLGERAMFITKKGLLGFGRRDVQVGDQVWIFRGGKMPMTLRPCEGHGSERKRFAYVGPSYADGIMDGELVPEVEKNSEAVTLI